MNETCSKAMSDLVKKFEFINCYSMGFIMVVGSVTPNICYWARRSVIDRAAYYEINLWNTKFSMILHIKQCFVGSVVAIIFVSVLALLSWPRVCKFLYIKDCIVQKHTPHCCVKSWENFDFSDKV